MAQKKVVWTNTAAKQRSAILKYWVERNGSNSYSLRLLELSNRKADLIDKNPELFKAADYPQTRVASMGHYSIFYQIRHEQVIITAFWDNRRDPKELIKALKKN